jgi:hypothetical protein
VTSQEPYTQHLADPDLPDTEVILVEQPAPVFVDSTGRRRRLLRRFSYAFGAFCMVYGGLISLSLAGGPVSPNAVLPFPDLIDGANRDSVEVRPTSAPEPAVTAPRAVLVNENLPRRAAAPRQEGIAGARSATRPGRATGPSGSASPRPSASATPTRTRPLESTRVPTTSPSATVPVPTTTPNPAPTGTGGTGGSGGGNGEATDGDGTGGGGSGGGGTGTGSGGDGSGDGGSGDGSPGYDGPGDDESPVDGPEDGRGVADGPATDPAAPDTAPDDDRVVSLLDPVPNLIDVALSPGTSLEVLR